MQLFHYGQRIRFPATLVTPRNYRNPGAFDYATYLRDKGIIATASTKYVTLEMLPGFSGSRVMFALARVHRSVLGKVHALWPERVAGLMDAIVIGEESFIDRPERVDFQRSGTYHVLVVSGMNVSILAMFTLWTLRRTGLNEIAASLRHRVDSCVCATGQHWAAGVARGADVRGVSCDPAAVSQSGDAQRAGRGGAGAADRRSGSVVRRKLLDDISVRRAGRGGPNPTAGADGRALSKRTAQSGCTVLRPLAAAAGGNSGWT